MISCFWLWSWLPKRITTVWIFLNRSLRKKKCEIWLRFIHLMKMSNQVNDSSTNRITIIYLIKFSLFLCLIFHILEIVPVSKFVIILAICCIVSLMFMKQKPMGRKLSMSGLGVGNISFCQVLIILAYLQILNILIGEHLINLAGDNLWGSLKFTLTEYSVGFLANVLLFIDFFAHNAICPTKFQL